VIRDTRGLMYLFDGGASVGMQATIRPSQSSRKLMRATVLKPKTMSVCTADSRVHLDTPSHDSNHRNRMLAGASVSGSDVQETDAEHKTNEDLIADGPLKTPENRHWHDDDEINCQVDGHGGQLLNAEIATPSAWYRVPLLGNGLAIRHEYAQECNAVTKYQTHRRVCPSLELRGGEDAGIQPDNGQLESNRSQEPHDSARNDQLAESVRFFGD
jgi:hypothetical protein